MEISERFVQTPWKQWEISLRLLLVTDRKSHTGFQFVPVLMTLNDRNAPLYPVWLSFINLPHLQQALTTRMMMR